MSQNLPSNFIFLNGPPGVGKDTIANNWYAGAMRRYVSFSFADPLKSAVHVMLGLDPDPLAYDAVKNQPLAEFHGMTPRAMYQWFAEDCVKPKFGKGFYGRSIANQIKSGHLTQNFMHNDIVVLRDLGFKEELYEIVESALASEDPKRISRFVVVHMYRDDKTFAGGKDTRGYITREHVAPEHVNRIAFCKLYNNTTIADAQETLANIVASAF